MPTTLNNTISSPYNLRDEQTWANLITLLRVRARHFVYSATVVRWRGQEEDIIEDVVQETMRRIIERSQRAERGEASPISSLECMAVRIARNYLTDLLRSEHRLQRFSSEEAFAQDDRLNAFEIAIEHVMQEDLFVQLSRVVALFPEKRRKALLIDLANRMDLGIELTPLQKAFLAEKMDLQAYQQALPTDFVQRTRHLMLVRLAYKQITVMMREFSLD